MNKMAARNAWLLIPGMILGIGFGIFLNGYWLIDKFPVGSRQVLFYTALASLIGTAGYTLLTGWIRNHLRRLSPAQIAALAGAGAVFGIFLFFAGTGQWQSNTRYVTTLLPSHALRVSVQPAQPPGETDLIWFNTSLGEISFDAIKAIGWKREGDKLVLQDPSNNILSWTGKPGSMVQLVFQDSLRNGKAVITLDGQEESLDLSSEKTSYNHSFEIPFYAGRLLILILGLINFILLSLAACVLILEKRGMLEESISQSFTRTKSKWSGVEVTLLLSAIILAFLLRVFNLGNLFPAVDEYYQLIAAKQIVQGAALSSVYPRSLWMVTLPVTVAFRLFGYQLWAARAVGVMFNVLAIVPLYFLTRKINRPIAVLSVVLYATSPWIITFARVVREYAYYPFYFYLIILGMVKFLEGIPEGFVFTKDWKIFIDPKMAVLSLALLFPPIYGFYIDRQSTFSVILVAYLVFGLFIVLKFNLKDRRNLPMLALISGGILAGAYEVWEQHIGFLSLAPKMNPFPIQYFFPNPQQQWYFDRLAIVPVIGFLCSVLICFLVRRINPIPLFLLTLYASFLGFFIFFSKNFFHTRHLSTTELWYILLIAIGMYTAWSLLMAIPGLKGKAAQTLLILFLGISAVNPQEILLPTTSNNPDMPISEDYYHDMSLVQGFMINQPQGSDVLISTIYGLYVTWEGEPSFRTIYRVTSQTLNQEVFALVDQNPSGWIVIDKIRLDQASMTVKDLSGKDQIEYMGLFGDEYVWHWQHASAQSSIQGVAGKRQ